MPNWILGAFKRARKGCCQYINLQNKINSIKHQNQGKQLTLCKVPVHIGIKGNEEVEKAAKQAIDMLGMTTITRLTHTDYFLFIRRAKNTEEMGK